MLQQCKQNAFTAVTFVQGLAYKVFYDSMVVLFKAGTI